MPIRKKQNRRIYPSHKRRLKSKIQKRNIRFALVLKGIIIGLNILVLTYLWSLGDPHRWTQGIQDRISNLMIDNGFIFQEVELIGKNQTTREEVLKVLDADFGKPLIYCDPQQIKGRLQSLPWVRTITVQRRYPNTIYIHFSERHPLALWQSNSKLYLIDDKGDIVYEGSVNKFTYLPLLVGIGAPKKAPSLLSELNQYPSISSRVTAANFISQRRWDLILDNKLTIKLPEGSIAESLAYFIKLDAEHNLIQRDIIAIDFRIYDRLFFYLSPKAKLRQKMGQGKQV